MGDVRALLTGADGEALYLRIGDVIHRLGFQHPIEDMTGLRKETVAMCKPEYWTPSAPSQATA